MTATLEQVSHSVRGFYERCSFPGYDDFDTPQDLARKASRGVYARLLDEELPLGVRILDAGCGTGQLGLFLSILNRQVIGIDFSHASLCKGQGFKERFGLRRVHFAQMDLFRIGLQEESFDYVFCNGVLHHTADAYGAFRNLVRFVKKGGYIVIGLYNTYGRLLLDLRRVLFRLTGDRFLGLDHFMRQRGLGDEKKRVWFMDQYKHPHEDKFSVDDVLDWFRLDGIEYVSSVPRISLGQPETGSLFVRRDPGTRLDHILCQLRWMFSASKEGGYFLTIGRRL